MGALIFLLSKEVFMNRKEERFKKIDDRMWSLTKNL
jgi:hypothetical protein